MDRNSDTESEGSVPEVLSREQISEFNNGDLIFNQNYFELNTVNQRFYEMNKQIGDLTSLVLALTKKISFSNRRGNGLNTVSNYYETRSDRLENYIFFNWRKQKAHFSQLKATQKTEKCRKSLRYNTTLPPNPKKIFSDTKGQLF